MTKDNTYNDKFLDELADKLLDKLLERCSQPECMFEDQTVLLITYQVSLHSKKMKKNV